MMKEREKRNATGKPLTIGDWIWVQDYECLICGTAYAVGFLEERNVLRSVECENCGCDMVQAFEC